MRCLNALRTVNQTSRESLNAVCRKGLEQHLENRRGRPHNLYLHGPPHGFVCFSVNLTRQAVSNDHFELVAAEPPRWTTGDSPKMNSKTRFPDSGENDLPRELIDLARAISALPEEQQAELEPTYSRVVDSVKRRRRILSLVQEALAQLRLDIKYLMFDLEVTRKERDELRERLD